MPVRAGAEYNKLILPSLIVLVTAALDQITKFLAVSNLTPGEDYPVIGNFFRFKLLYNDGGALGTNFGGASFYLASAILILILVAYFIYANRDNRFVSLSMALIAGGAVGNIIDRIQNGKVVDFIDFDFFDFNLFGQQIERWWTFNIADSAITAGIIVLMIYILFLSRPPRPLPSDRTETAK